MINGILGIKMGMTQLFGKDGIVIPATVIKAGPCVVIQKKSASNDGYAAVQLGLVEFASARRVNKPMAGHFFFGVTHPSQCGQDSIFAHRPLVRCGARKDISATGRPRREYSVCERLKLAENIHSLARQRNDMLLAHLHPLCGNTPFGFFKINFRPRDPNQRTPW